jgi:hypothetical protein
MMSLRQYSGSFLWPVVAIIVFSAACIAIIFWLLFGAVNATAGDIDQPCLTKDQARAKWPTSYLYWHTANRCWDNRKGGGATYTVSRAATWGKQNSLKLPKPNLDASANVVRHSGRPIIVDPPQPRGPNIFYPAVMVGTGTSDSMLTPYTMQTWPVIVDFDVEPPLFIPWNERISTVFEKQ